MKAAEAARLAADLSPLPISGEALRFDLSSYHSTVTRQMLQLRVRRTALTFGAGIFPVPATVTLDGSTLLVDAAELQRANASVEARLAAGPAGAILYLRQLAAARQALDRTAARVRRALAARTRPTKASLLAYVAASAKDQALGALKFCMPRDLRSRLASVLGTEADLDAHFAPDRPSLWTTLRARELALAALRLHGPGKRYSRQLHLFRQRWGYLYAEDIDFQASETLDALDARIAALGDGVEVAAARRRARDALARERTRKRAVGSALAQRLSSGTAGADAPRLISHLLLAAALAGHEDSNRQGKMRFLRDCRDLAVEAGLPIARASLLDLVAVCR